MESWPERGCYVVEVDMQRLAKSRSTRRSLRARKPAVSFHRLGMKTDLYSGPDEFYAACRQYLERRARDLGAEATCHAPMRRWWNCN